MSTSSKLSLLGFTDFFLQQLYAGEASLAPARVLGVQRGVYKVAGDFPTASAQISGRLGFVLGSQDEYPAVGDWVLVRVDHNDAQGPKIIERILERKSSIVRKQVGESSAAQIIAANVDYGLIVQSCNQDFNPRRIERYLLAIEEGGVQPVVLLNKSDLLCAADDQRRVLEQLGTIATSYAVHFLSALHADSLADLSRYWEPGVTSVLIGSSGVGKSTLTNRLNPDIQQTVREIREEDDKGRHTTTSRDLFFTATGGMVIDTPGMREFGLWNTDAASSGLFSDIEALAVGCRFQDCRHSSEPGCNVRKAVEAGDIDPERMESLRKYRREEAFQKRRSDRRESANAKKKWKEITKSMRKNPKKNW